jgi:hypothetical protein
MDKYRINHALHGKCEFFIEATTLELAYEVPQEELQRNLVYCHSRF